MALIAFEVASKLGQRLVEGGTSYDADADMVLNIVDEEYTLLDTAVEQVHPPEDGAGSCHFTGEVGPTVWVAFDVQHPPES